jgi:hypothetical protein
MRDPGEMTTWFCKNLEMSDALLVVRSFPVGPRALLALLLEICVVALASQQRLTLFLVPQRTMDEVLAVSVRRHRL